MMILLPAKCLRHGWAMGGMLLMIGMFAGTAQAACTLGSSAVCGDGPCASLTRPTGTLIYNADLDVMQSCGDDGNWQALSPLPRPPTGCPNPGDTCSDGSIYAGTSPDGGGRMYTTTADQGAVYWDDGAGIDQVTMGGCYADPVICDTGKANTLLLQSLENSGSPAPYQAAQLCYDLVAHSRTDWYLPARDEMLELQSHKDAGALSGSFSESYYWTSSEQAGNGAVYVGIADGSTGDGVKYGFQNGVRCVRRDS